jgi:hypothetical protein
MLEVVLPHSIELKIHSCLVDVDTSVGVLLHSWKDGEASIHDGMV